MKCLLTAFAFITFALTSLGQNTTTFTIYPSRTVQTIRNIGASACWYGEEVGTWPQAKRQRMAELLFSRGFDKKGQPKGIGLSAFRFNIGAGTAEQGDSSGITEAAHRVECFLSPDGTYHWDKQKGYTWLLQQAKSYGVENLIAFVNSPPVQFTKTGLGYKLAKDYMSNLKEDKYGDYANFLVQVMKHYDSNGLHFNYISPVNEPQWDWSGVPGDAKQEGSPWTNEEIYKVVQHLSGSLSSQKLTTQILMPEAATLSYLFEPTGKSGRQAKALFTKSSPLYVGNLPNTTPFVEGHSYFTEVGDVQTVTVRSRLRDTLKSYGGLEFWQSEYCMLGDGYKDGLKVNKRSAMDVALYLAKVINTDFTVANATAWHYWNSFEPGPADSNTLYYLVALNPNRAKDTANLYTVTKNAWALGHYSLFVRPGMQRIETGRSDGRDSIAAAKDIMIAAFKDASGIEVVVNMINYTTEDKVVAINGVGGLSLTAHYVTSAKQGDDMKRYPVPGKALVLPARSINTFVFRR